MNTPPYEHYIGKNSGRRPKPLFVTCLRFEISWARMRPAPISPQRVVSYIDCSRRHTNITKRGPTLGNAVGKRIGTLSLVATSHWSASRNKKRQPMARRRNSCARGSAKARGLIADIDTWHLLGLKPTPEAPLNRISAHNKSPERETYPLHSSADVRGTGHYFQASRVPNNSKLFEVSIRSSRPKPME